MKPLTEIRRENLARLVDEVGTQVALAQLIHKDRNQIHQWLLEPGAPGARNIGTASARLLETATGKPAGWMDHAQEARAPGPRTDPARMRDAIYFLDYLGELQGVPGLSRDPLAICIAYDFLEAFDKPAENVLDVTKKLAAKLKDSGPVQGD